METDTLPVWKNEQEPANTPQAAPSRPFTYRKKRRKNKDGFPCEHCDDRFKNKVALSIHLSKAHGIAGKFRRASASQAMFETGPDGLFHCEHCDAAFRGAAGLGSHRLKIHGIPGLFSHLRHKSDLPIGRPRKTLDALASTKERARERNRVMARERYYRLKAEKVGQPHRPIYVSGAENHEAPRPQNLEAVLNYCPSCGANLRKIENSIRQGVYQ